MKEDNFSIEKMATIVEYLSVLDFFITREWKMKVLCLEQRKGSGANNWEKKGKINLMVLVGFKAQSILTVGFNLMVVNYSSHLSLNTPSTIYICTTISRHKQDFFYSWYHKLKQIYADLGSLVALYSQYVLSINSGRSG